MAHLKRHSVPKKWPIQRKGTTFVVKPLSGEIPLLIVLRNMLKIAQTRKEVKRALHLKHILVNNKEIKEERQGLSLFDTITIIPSKKSYRVIVSELGKFALEEIKEAEANKKIARVMDKKALKGKKLQLNLSDGRNFISDIKCNTNDSVVVNFKEKKLEKCLPFKDGANVMIFAGKHLGQKGVVKKIKAERKMVAVTVGKEEINALIKQIIVVE